jgi:hypothetical protein
MLLGGASDTLLLAMALKESRNIYSTQLGVTKAVCTNQRAKQTQGIDLARLDPDRKLPRKTKNLFSHPGGSKGICMLMSQAQAPTKHWSSNTTVTQRTSHPCMHAEVSFTGAGTNKTNRKLITALAKAHS